MPTSEGSQTRTKEMRKQRSIFRNDKHGDREKGIVGLGSCLGQSGLNWACKRMYSWGMLNLLQKFKYVVFSFRWIFYVYMETHIYIYIHIFSSYSYESVGFLKLLFITARTFNVTSTLLHF